MELVQLKKETLRASSFLIAERIGYEHRAILKNIKTYFSDFLEFGDVLFEDELVQTKGGIQERTVAFLNEAQAAYLVTILRNTPIVRNFKLALIKAFEQAKKMIRNEREYEVPRTFSQALLLAANQARIIEEQEKKIVQAQPKVEYYDSIMSSTDGLSVVDTAKALGYLNLGQNNLFKFLRERKLLQDNNAPFQEFINRGYFKCIIRQYTNQDGDLKTYTKTLVLPKGIEHIKKLLDSLGYKKA